MASVLLELDLGLLGAVLNCLILATFIKCSDGKNGFYCHFTVNCRQEAVGLANGAVGVITFCLSIPRTDAV